MIPSEETILEAIQIAREMLNGNMHLILGCRILRNLSLKSGLYEDNIFTPFIAVDSETDHFPIGKMRDLCDLDYLKRVDVEINEYLDIERPYIITSCQNLINKFEQRRTNTEHISN